MVVLEIVIWLFDVVEDLDDLVFEMNLVLGGMIDEIDSVVIVG